MKKIVQLLKTFLKEDFQVLYYLSIALFLALLMALNYSLSIEKVIDEYNGQLIRVLFYIILYGVTYSGACLITFYFNGWPRTPWKFVLIASFGILVLSFSAGFPYTTQVMNLVKFDYDYYIWFYHVSSNLLGLLKVFIPLLIFSFVAFHDKRERLGLNANHLDLRPYAWLLLLVLPLVIIASFETGFKNYYPTFQRYAPINSDDSMWFYAGIYELSYAFDFINVELLFRGFFVIGISRLLGKDAIIPMVAIYCSLHFGKPLGEAISSIFGGYILGVIAFYTRNIWGGIMVHIGLALMMEAVAYWQKTLIS